MKRFSVYFAEIRYEIRAGMRGPLFPLAAVGFAAYILLVLSSAEKMRVMGAVGLPRNSAHLVYLFSTGTALWVYFTWAWVFGQAVMRDRAVGLQENVLASPVSLGGILLARYLGASVVGFILASIMALAMLLVPVLGWLGAVPPELIGPAPWRAVFWSLVILVLPSTLGIGALYVAVAVWTRKVAGPFVAAALLVLVWMIALSALGDVGDTAEILVDPSAWAAMISQIRDWTPQEKMTRFPELSRLFVMNRAIWLLVPLGLLLATIWRTRRERLILVSPRKRKPCTPKASGQSFAGRSVSLPILPDAKPCWLKALWQETLWQLRLSISHWGLLLTLAFLVFLGVGSSVMHAVKHAQGPMVPRAFYLLPNTQGIFFLFMVFGVAGFVGALARHDQRMGFHEMLDATPAPPGVRVLGKVLAAVAVTTAFVLIPTLNAWIVMLLASPDLNLSAPVLFNLLVRLPPLLEIGLFALLAHAVIRHAGAAYAVSMMIGFIAVMNHELNLVSYPPAQIGVPAHITLSSLGGWRPWLGSLLTTDLLKLGLVIVLAALVWIAWPRGVDNRLRQRLRDFLPRTLGGAGLLAAVGVVVMLVSAVVLYQHLVVHGEYQSLQQRLSQDAAWEKRWWKPGGQFSVAGGQAHVKIDANSRQGEVTWRLTSVCAASGLLQGSLPHGLTIKQARVQGKPVNPKVEYDQFALPLGDCPVHGCDVALKLTVALRDWPDHDRQSWLTPSGVWMRAADVLPTLGLDPERLLRGPAERTTFGLKAEPVMPDRQTLKAGQGVAPAGTWQWSVEVLTPGVHTKSHGKVNGPLDFAFAWLPKQPAQLAQKEVIVWHGSGYRQTATEIVEDIRLMRRCVSDLLGITSPVVRQVLQAPREFGPARLHGDVLWLPENEGWDVAGKGFGRQHRRAGIASALTAYWLTSSTDLRAEPGSQWLLSGIPGWVGLECVHRTASTREWLAQMKWQSDQITEALGTLEAPVRRVADAGEANWIKPYITLSTLNWAAGQGAEQTAALVKALLRQLKNNATLPGALAKLIGQQTAGRLLGMPLAADVALRVDDKQQVKVSAQRWQWHNNGWKLIEPPRVILQLKAQDMQLFDLQKSPGISTAQDFIVLDSWPSAERTPEDNVWIHAVEPDSF